MTKADVITRINTAYKSYEKGLLTWFEYRTQVWETLIESKITDNEFITTIMKKTKTMEG